MGLDWSDQFFWQRVAWGKAQGVFGGGSLFFLKKAGNLVRYNNLNRKKGQNVESIAIGSDHGGYHLKEEVKAYLEGKGYSVVDVGTDSETSVDYPDFAAEVARTVQGGKADLGILICGTGIGMAITANKFRGIRAAVVHDAYTAEMSRRHNNANIITFGGRVVGAGVAFSIVDAWLGNTFEGGRHTRRLGKIEAFEKENF